MTGHVTLPCKVNIFIFDNDWGMFSWCSGWHASGCRFNSWSGQNFFWLK